MYCVCCVINKADNHLDFCDACGACSVYDPCYGSVGKQIAAMMGEGNSREEALARIKNARER